MLIMHILSHVNMSFFSHITHNHMCREYCCFVSTISQYIRMRQKVNQRAGQLSLSHVTNNVLTESNKTKT